MGQTKIKKLKPEPYTFWKCYIQDAPRKKQYHCFFHGAPKIPRINDFYTYTLGKLWQIKIKKLKSGHYTFWKCYIEVAPWRKHITASLTERLKFNKNWLLHMHFGLIVANYNKKTRIRTLYILKLLLEVMKQLPSRSTRNYKNRWLLYIHVGQIEANQNQKTKLRTLYILKLL